MAVVVPLLVAQWITRRPQKLRNGGARPLLTGKPACCYQVYGSSARSGKLICMINMVECSLRLFFYSDCYYLLLLYCLLVSSWFSIALLILVSNS